MDTFEGGVQVPCHGVRQCFSRNETQERDRVWWTVDLSGTGPWVLEFLQAVFGVFCASGTRAALEIRTLANPLLKAAAAMETHIKLLASTHTASRLSPERERLRRC